MKRGIMAKNRILKHVLRYCNNGVLSNIAAENVNTDICNFAQSQAQNENLSKSSNFDNLEVFKKVSEYEKS